MRVKPGYDASASSTAAAVKGLPTGCRVGVLDRAAQQGGGALLGVGVGGREDELGPGRLLRRPRRERRGELVADPGRLGVDVEAGEHELDGVAPAAELVDAHLELRGRGLAADAGDGHPVGSLLAEPDRVEVGGDVGAEVAGGLDLVDELGGDGVDGDRAPGAVVLGDHARPVGGDLGQREPEGTVPVGQAEEAAEVAARGLGAALEDVAGDDGARELVVLLGCPAVVRDRGPDDQRGVGDPAGDDHVGAAAQGGGDAEAAEVGVGRERAVPEAERAQVVALDVGDGRVEAEAAGDLAEALGEAGGVEAAGVGDDPHAALEGETEAVLDLADEGAGVAERGVLHGVATEDEHRQLGEVVAGEDVQRPALQHLAHRGQPVAVEAGAVADPQGTGG